MSHTLVLGVGNTLLTDEGAGVHAMYHLKRHGHLSPDIEFLDAGTLSFMLADAIAEATNLIIFDAAQLDEEPGSLQVFEGNELDDFLIGGKRSVHEVGFADLMDIARLQDCLPVNRALIGIQPGEFGWGDRPGETVSAAIPRAADLARQLLDRWSEESTPEVMNQ
jgi:hydrogenase maturation protease